MEACVPVTLWPQEGELTGISPSHAPPVNNHVLAISSKTGLLMTPVLPTLATMDTVAIVTGSTGHSSLDKPQGAGVSC